MRLRRARRDRWVLGVCGGAAHTYGWNSMVVRLVVGGLAVVSILGGPSFLLLAAIYALLGYFLPETDEF